LGQLAFRQIRIVVEQRFGGHEPEHGVAEEFEALIGGDPPASKAKERCVSARRKVSGSMSIPRLFLSSAAVVSVSTVSDVSYLAARVLEVQRGAGGVFDDPGLVGARVHNATVLHSLDQVRSLGLPLRTTVAGVAARQFTL